MVAIGVTSLQLFVAETCNKFLKIASTMTVLCIVQTNSDLLAVLPVILLFATQLKNCWTYHVP